MRSRAARTGLRQAKRSVGRRDAESPADARFSTSTAGAFAARRTLGMLLVRSRRTTAFRCGEPPTSVRPARRLTGRRRTSVVSLRELLGVVGAHEWRREGHRIPSDRWPHSSALRRLRAGAPRSDADLVANAPLPAATALGDEPGVRHRHGDRRARRGARAARDRRA